MPGPVVSTPEESPTAFREILRTMGLVRRVMDPYFARHGVSGAQWAVLRNVYRAEQAGCGGLKLADLGSRLLVRPPSVTHVVERLRVAGLLSREASTTDQRAKCVRLTDAGRDVVEKLLGQHDKQISVLMAPLGPADQATLQALLGQLNRHLETVVPHDASGNEAMGGDEETR